MAVTCVQLMCVYRAKLRDHVSSLGSKPSAEQRNNLAERRRRLQTRITTHINNTKKWMIPAGGKNLPAQRDLNDVGQSTFVKEPSEGTADGPEGRRRRCRGRRHTENKPENALLWMPSSLGEETCLDLGFPDILKQEISLRQGQANDALHELRLGLGAKSLLLRTKVRQASSQRTRTRAWSEVNKASDKVDEELGSYRRCRNALAFLNPNDGTFVKYKVITDKDLKMVSDVTEENRVGQRSDKLAWFWRLDGDKDMDDASWMEESECDCTCDDRTSMGLNGLCSLQGDVAACEGTERPMEGGTGAIATRDAVDGAHL